MRTFRMIADPLVDVITIGLAAAVGILILGRAADSSLWARVETVPLIGELATGVRAALDELYRPA